jgi:polygalacturonase
VDIRRRELLRLTTASVFAAGWVQRSSAQDPDGRSAFDVRSFGATADGKTLDTPSVNRAIAAAAAIGGGAVRFPAGVYADIPFASKALSRSILNPVRRS